MMLAVRVLLLTIAFHTTDGFRFNLPQNCEKITIPLCRRVLPYNLTRFPNLLGDRSQVLANRSIQRYSPLVQQANCSRHAVFFLCSYYLPICLPGIDETEQNVIKPCRSLCEQVRTDCGAVINYWPSFVKCEELPEFSDSVCIRPESFVSVKRPARIIDYDPCEGRTAVDFNLSTIEQCEYVIKFKVILIERLENKGTIIRGRVMKVFKENNVTIHKGRAKIWSKDNSTCPSLRTGNVFLICGNVVNTSKGKQLSLSSTSRIEAWNEETMRKIRRWQRQERKGTKKGRKRSNM